MDYARFCEMLLQGGQLNGVRIIAPRTVEMPRWRTANCAADAIEVIAALGPEAAMTRFNTDAAP